MGLLTSMQSKLRKTRLRRASFSELSQDCYPSPRRGAEGHATERTKQSNCGWAFFGRSAFSTGERLSAYISPERHTVQDDRIWHAQGAFIAVEESELKLNVVTRWETKHSRHSLTPT